MSTHYAAQERPNERPAVYAVFHGDGPEITFEEMVDTKKYNQKMTEYSRPWNKFEGTDRSKIWLSFLLGETSPWKDIRPYIIDDDLDWVNNAGVIFKTDGLPKKLWYNFIMALRYPNEQAMQYSLMLLLIEHGIEANLSCYISNHFYLQPGAKSLTEGPWSICYPMTYMEGLTLGTAARFILSKPANIHETYTPCCEELWNIGNTEAEIAAEDVAAKLANNELLTLDEILNAVNSCVETQKAYL
jgi:hypothetical protein